MRNRPGLKEWHNALLEIYKSKPRSKYTYVLEVITYLIVASGVTALVIWMALVNVSRNGRVFPWFLIATYVITAIIGWIRFFITVRKKPR